MKNASMLRRIVDWIGLAFDRIGQAAILCLVAVTAVDAGGRYLMDYSLPGALEITEHYLMIAVVFLTLARTQQLGGNIRIDILRDRFSPQLARRLDIVYLLFALAVYVLITFVAIRFGWRALEANRWTAGLLPLPVGPSWMILGAGMIALCLRLSVQIVDLVRGVEDSSLSVPQHQEGA